MEKQETDSMLHLQYFKENMLLVYYSYNYKLTLLYLAFQQEVCREETIHDDRGVPSTSGSSGGGMGCEDRPSPW